MIFLTEALPPSMDDRPELISFATLSSLCTISIQYPSVNPLENQSNYKSLSDQKSDPKASLHPVPQNFALIEEPTSAIHLCIPADGAHPPQEENRAQPDAKIFVLGRCTDGFLLSSDH